MVMDVVVLAVFALSIFLAMHRGFALTVINFARVIVALALGFLFCDKLRDLLVEKTGLERWISEKLAAGYAKSLADVLRNSMTGIILQILSFALIVAVVFAVSIVLKHFLSRQYQGGFIGFADWLLGGLLGVCCGMFNVFLLLALILPVCGVFFPELMDKITASLASSYFAGDLYDNNLLLLIFHVFF